eukprot:14256333-Alexandrium_andersonii.AAC.1
MDVSCKLPGAKHVGPSAATSCRRNNRSPHSSHNAASSGACKVCPCRRKHSIKNMTKPFVSAPDMLHLA